CPRCLLADTLEESPRAAVTPDRGRGYGGAEDEETPMNAAAAVDIAARHKAPASAGAGNVTLMDGFEIPSRLGNYRLLEKIGDGAFGFVFRARHQKISKQYAIKVLRPELAANAEVVSRFFVEADSAAKIANEHIIDISDFDESPTPYFVMELLQGS